MWNFLCTSSMQPMFQLLMADGNPSNFPNIGNVITPIFQPLEESQHLFPNDWKKNLRPHAVSYKLRKNIAVNPIEFSNVGTFR